MWLVCRSQFSAPNSCARATKEDFLFPVHVSIVISFGRAAFLGCHRVWLEASAQPGKRALSLVLRELFLPLLGPLVAWGFFILTSQAASMSYEEINVVLTKIKGGDDDGDDSGYGDDGDDY